MRLLSQRNIARRFRSGSALIIVLWVAFGLVSMALYFGNSMSLELRAADNRAASVEADQAIDGAARYAIYLLQNAEARGRLPDLQYYLREAAPVGDATFWFIGFTNQLQSLPDPVFGLVDEASKLNINTATAEMLQYLPGMTAEFAAAIEDWRDSDGDVNALGGAEEEAYSQRNPQYRCKNAAFESLDELRMVAGATEEILYGEDANQNGVLDPNENDGNTSPPYDNRDGRLEPGILKFLTVHTSEPSVTIDGTNRVQVSNAQQLRQLLQDKFGDRGAQMLPGGGGGGQAGQGYGSVLDFFLAAEMTDDEAAQISPEICGTNLVGLVNVNTASEEALACIPGIGLTNAPVLTAYRQSNPSRLTSMLWVKDVLDENSARQAGPYLTGESYQATADVAALGHHGRGYRRVRYVIDASEAVPRIVYRQDMTHLGWALGRNVQENRHLLATTIKR